MTKIQRIAPIDCHHTQLDRDICQTYEKARTNAEPFHMLGALTGTAHECHLAIAQMLADRQASEHVLESRRGAFCPFNHVLSSRNPVQG